MLLRHFFSVILKLENFHFLRKDVEMMLELLNSIDLGSLIHTFDLNAWDPKNMFNNGKDWVKAVGGAFIGLLGTITIVWAAVHLVKVAFSKQGRGGHVLEAVIALVIGGALAFGGISLLTSMSNGGYKSAEELGK